MTRQTAASDDRPDAAETQVRLLGIVTMLAAEVHPGQVMEVTLDSTLDRDLGFDSLARVELISRVERNFGVTLPDQVFATMETPRDLLRAVTSEAGRAVQSAPVVVQQARPQLADVAPVHIATLTEALDWHVATHPDRPHIRLYSDTDEGEVITYGDLRRQAERMASGLQSMDLRVGEPVAIMLPTSPEYFYSFFGVLLAGGIPVPLYPPTRPGQIADHMRRQANILANCQAGLLISERATKTAGRLLKSHADSLRAVVTPDEVSSAAKAGPFIGPRRSDQDVALLQYTSGSTGQPKGVVLTHANLLANVRAMAQAMDVTSEDVFVSWLPLYHDMGLIGAWLGSLLYAALLVIMPPLMFLARPQRWLWAVHRYRATMSAAPNFAYELCLRRIAVKDIEGLDLSSWRVACNGAEPVSPLTVERFCARFAEYGFRYEAMMPVYGLAESSVGLAFPPLDRGSVIDAVERTTFTRSGRAVPAAATDANALQFVASGQPLPRHEIRIVDRAGRELPERQEGRLQFRGPSACSGYYRNPAETRRLFDGEWLDTGDLAYLASGDVHITGRSKDIIIRAGRNIYPDEFEEAVGELDGVQKGNVAVFASTDRNTGTERLVVLAETRRRDTETQDRLRRQINDLAVELVGTPPDDIRLAPPRTVLKTSSGKIRRAASRDVYERGLNEKPGRPYGRPSSLQLVRFAVSRAMSQVRRATRNVAATLYACWAWTIVSLLAPVLWSGIATLPPSWRWPVCRAGLRLIAAATATPLSIQGQQNLPPLDRPSTFVSNHASYLDGLTLVALLPQQVAFVAKVELAGNWITAIPLRRLGAVFVERFDRQKGIDDARRVAEKAGAGNPLLFFAEGTFTRMPGLLPFHMGAFVAAVEADTPIVPITIRGTRSILRAGSWFPRRGAISLHIGKPILPARLRTEAEIDPWTLALKLRDRTRAEILQHCGEPDLSYERPPLWIGVPPNKTAPTTSS